MTFGPDDTSENARRRALALDAEIARTEAFAKLLVIVCVAGLFLGKGKRL